MVTAAAESPADGEAPPEPCADRRAQEGKRGPGRPRAAVNPETVARLAAILCTVDEIAAVCGCSKDTLERNFAAALKRGRERGKCSLRRAHFKAALKGNPTMLIWLGEEGRAATRAPTSTVLWGGIARPFTPAA